MKITLNELREIIVSEATKVAIPGKLGRQERKIRAYVGDLARGYGPDEEGEKLIQAFASSLPLSKKRLVNQLIAVAMDLGELIGREDDYEEGATSDEELDDEYDYGGIPGGGGKYALETKIADTEDSYNRLLKKVFPR